jgi:4-oxalocrotonate tautomerase
MGFLFDKPLVFGIKETNKIDELLQIQRMREVDMPLIQIDGPRLDVNKKRDLAKRITEVAMGVYNIPHITVIIRENSLENVASNGELIIDKQSKDSGE